MRSRNEEDLNQIANDVHLLTTPLRFIWRLLVTTIFVCSFPLLCALVSLHYMIGNIDLVRSFCNLFDPDNIPAILRPFILLGALVALALQAVLGVVEAVAEIFDAIWRYFPLFATMLLALVNCFWLVIVRATYAWIDGEDLSSVPMWGYVFFGFVVSLVAQFYLLPYREDLAPSALFVLATGASASPSLLYLLYRAFKPSAQR